MKLVLAAFLLASSSLCQLTWADVSGSIVFDQGWRLWLDPEAAWQNDALYLPEDVNLQRLPVNAPTGGWPALGDKAGIPVSLPATVEQYYFGKAPARKA